MTTTSQASQSPQSPSRTGARERMRGSHAADFSAHIARPVFEFNYAYYVHPLLDAHRAWAIMLHEQGALSKEDLRPILEAIQVVEGEGPEALLPFNADIEYFYLHVERALNRHAPEEVIGNLNLGRTRPEPLARIVTRDLLLRFVAAVLDLRRALLDRAAEHAATVIPGYTHLQHAQPITFGHYLAGFQDHLARDTARLLAAYENVDHNTLGCGAMAGTSLRIDRARVAALLGFHAVRENTNDSVAATDHMLESLSAAATLMVGLSRLAQDLYLWASFEFGFLDVSDAYASPSSLMPQKKNALFFEYLRANAAVVVGHLQAALTMSHQVPYQDTEDVEFGVTGPTIAALELSERMVTTLAGQIRSLQVDAPRALALAEQGAGTTSALAEGIHTHTGLSYRTAHRIVARSVRLALEQTGHAAAISPTILDAAAQEMIGQPLRLGESFVRDYLDPSRFVEAHSSNGGTAPAEVRRMIEARATQLADDEQQLALRRLALQQGQATLRTAVAQALT